MISYGGTLAGHNLRGTLSGSSMGKASSIMIASPNRACFLIQCSPVLPRYIDMRGRERVGKPRDMLQIGSTALHFPQIPALRHRCGHPSRSDKIRTFHTLISQFSCSSGSINKCQYGFEEPGDSAFHNEAVECFKAKISNYSCRRPVAEDIHILVPWKICL